MIISHHKNDSLKLANKQPIHDLVGNYHWHRLDDEHVIMVADYPVKNHKEIDKHPAVTIIPSLGSSKKLHKHISKQKHLDAIRKHFDITEDHTSEDLLDQLADKFGPMFTL